MGAAEYLVLLLTHPLEAQTLIRFYLWHAPKRDITSMSEHATSGWDRKTMRTCWSFLDKTSRSFAAVIKELDGDLARIICLFYLVLRGLDTVEDDMTIPDDVKQPILRSFHKNLSKQGWTFNGSGPDEADRQLLVEFDNVIAEMELLDPICRKVITDICEKMQTGMADFCHKAATATSSSSPYLETVADYDLYCHYVAGLVGEGLSALFSASQKEAPWLGSQLVLSNSMGLLLQKTNITRDYAEDVEQGRYFWPREIWGQYGFKEMKDLQEADKKGDKNALWALNGMVVNALGHAIDALDYLALLGNQSVFNFCAIPATMALATLALCYNNRAVLHRNVKIRKAHAVELIMRSKNPHDVAYMFRGFARDIHRKAPLTDPNFVRISVLCGKIEQWCEHYHPSFISVDPRTGITKMNTTTDSRFRTSERDAKLESPSAPSTPSSTTPSPSPSQLGKHEASSSDLLEGWSIGMILFMALFVSLVFFLATGVVYVQFIAPMGRIPGFVCRRGLCSK